MVEIRIPATMLAGIHGLRTSPSFPPGPQARAQRLIDLANRLETFQQQQQKKLPPRQTQQPWWPPQQRQTPGPGRAAVILYGNNDAALLEYRLMPIFPDGIELMNHVETLRVFLPPEMRSAVAQKPDIPVDETFSAKLSYAAIWLGLKVARVLENDGYIRALPKNPSEKGFALQHADLWNLQFSKV